MTGAASRQDFDEFYSSSAARLVRHGYALTGDMAEAQDIAQEAFARAWQRWPTVRECDSPEAWVRRVATNLAASRWRRIRVARAAAGRTAEPHAPEVSTDTVALVSGLRTLPERQRTALVLHYMCDLTVDQIAAELNCPSGSVKSWLSRGRTALAEAIQIVEPDQVSQPDLVGQPDQVCEPSRARESDTASQPARPCPQVQARPKPEASHA
jgi:RNA polymerase sigma-70 factor, ECF subfamily